MSNVKNDAKLVNDFFKSYVYVPEGNRTNDGGIGAAEGHVYYEEVLEVVHNSKILFASAHILNKACWEKAIYYLTGCKINELSEEKMREIQEEIIARFYIVSKNGTKFGDLIGEFYLKHLYTIFEEIDFQIERGYSAWEHCCSERKFKILRRQRGILGSVTE